MPAGAEERLMELTPADLTRIVEAFETSDWQHLRVSLGGSLLELSKSGPVDGALVAAPPAADSAAASAQVMDSAAASAQVMDSAAASAQVMDSAGASAPVRVRPLPDGAARPDDAASAGLPAVWPASAGLREIVSPSVGVFWRAPSPTSPPFVSEGDTVGEGDTVCIVEVMKLMNHVAAAVSGTVRGVLAENGQTVERGQPLFLVERAP
jgi:acetyl-CoA carboxylase biotin carboxyl carrier protein